MSGIRILTDVISGCFSKFCKPIKSRPTTKGAVRAELKKPRAPKIFAPKMSRRIPTLAAFAKFKRIMRRGIHVTNAGSITG